MFLSNRMFVIILSLLSMTKGSKGAAGTHQRTSMFLMQDYIPDGEAALSELQKMEEMEGDDYLTGSYGAMDQSRYRQHSILEPHADTTTRNETNDPDAPKNTISEKTSDTENPEPEFLVTPSDTFKQAVNSLPQGLQVIVTTFADNFQRVVSSAVNITNDISQPPTVNEVISLEWDCIKIRPACQLSSRFSLQCMYNCLTEDSPIANKFSPLVLNVLIGMCNPSGSTFQAAYQNIESDPKLATYITAIKADAKSLDVAAELGSDSLLNYVITGVTTPFLPLGAIARSMAKVVVDPSQPATDAIEKGWNKACRPEMLANNVFTLARAMKQDPGLMDIALPGYSTISTIIKYVPGDHQDHMSGFLEVFESLTGITCGLVYTSDTGSPLNCDTFGGFPRAGSKIKSVQARTNDDWKKYCKGE